MSVSAYPLSWPLQVQRKPNPAWARFSQDGKPLSIASARRRLLEEIDKITKYGRPYRVDPDKVVISTNVRTRNDGLPYSNVREPEDSAVAVYFDLDGVPHCLPCDAWDRVADNLAAIAAHIGAMRGMERWGVADIRQAFSGFQALPSSASSNPGAWWAVLGVTQGADFDTVRAAYQQKRKATHPDYGGTAGQFQVVQQAWRQFQEQYDE